MDQFDDRMVISQSQNDETPFGQHDVYEFNDEFEDDDLNNLNGFQLNRTTKNYQNQLNQDEESFSSEAESTDESSSEESNDESNDESNNDEFNNDESNDEINDETNEFSDEMELNQSDTSNATFSYAGLNDYVLFDIFKLLSLIELQQCRLVCKRWMILIDTIRIKKLSLTYFSKHSWSSNENYENLQLFADSVDVSSLDSFRRILLKPQFRDLENLSLVTEYATNTIESTTSEPFELDVSGFTKLKRLELSGSYIQLKEDQRCGTLTHLSIDHLTVDPMHLFPNLVHLKTSVYNSTTTNPNLRYLEYFSPKHHATLDHRILHRLAPNLKELSCYFLDAYALVFQIENLDEFLFKELTKIKVHFNSYLSYEFLIDSLIAKSASLKIQLEYHINETRNKTKGDLIKWNKFFLNRRIYTIHYGRKEVNLKELYLYLPNYENNTLLKQSLKVDNHSLQNINDKIYPYLFNTNSLELSADNVEDTFNYLLKTIPRITKLTINHRCSQSTFDRFKFNCPYLSHLKIISKQAYKLDLNFIHYLDHLTSIDFTNIDLINCSTIENKIKFSKFFHILQFRSCRLLDEDYSRITRAMVEKAKKNPGKLYTTFQYEFHSLVFYIR